MMMSKCEKLKGVSKLLLRLVVGGIFVYAGWMKLQNPAMVQGMLTSMNFPLPVVMAWVLSLSEFIFGILVVLGVFTAASTLPLMFAMLVAFLTVHIKDGLTNPMTQYVMLIFASLLTLCASGAGKYSVDAMMAKKK